MKKFLVQFLIQPKEEKVNESHLLDPRALVKDTTIPQISYTFFYFLLFCLHF